MIDILFNIGAALLGAAIGAGVGYALSHYLEKAMDWFSGLWQRLTGVKKGVGLLVKIGRLFFKRLLVWYFTGDYDLYGDEDDTGTEVDEDELSESARRALDDDGCIPVTVFE